MSIDAYKQLIVEGNVISKGEITAYTTSDMRLKKDIREVEYKESSFILSKVRPVKYKWNDKAFEFNANQRYKGEEYGIIAQELQAVVPCAIKTVFEEYMSIDYTRLIPPIIAVVNEHEKEIQRLKAKIKELEKKK